VLAAYFKDTPRGFVVDVGANDGHLNSCSEELLARGWSGLLIEPSALPFAALAAKYRDRPDVTCVNLAVGPYRHMATLYTEPLPSRAQFSTLDPEWRDRCIGQYGATFIEQVTTLAPLTEILDEHAKDRHIDFLTVDCEGYDLIVLQTLDWKRYRPRLVCVEGGFTTNPIMTEKWASRPASLAKCPDEYLVELGYRLHATTIGNRLFEARP
jgi:FkbM family methyltransferase